MKLEAVINGWTKAPVKTRWTFILRPVMYDRYADMMNLVVFGVCFMFSGLKYIKRKDNR